MKPTVDQNTNPPINATLLLRIRAKTTLVLNAVECVSLGNRHKSVTLPAHRVQQWNIETVFNLLAQAADVYVDDICLRVELKSPHRFEQHRSGDDLTGMSGKEFE
jgi:hypothetical protein